MPMLCPKCASSGEYLRMNEDREVRRCRVCQTEYECQIDVDDFPYPDDYGMEDYPEGGRTCPHCGSTKTQNQGAASDGDGDLYDDWHCSSCGENFEGYKVWIDDEGNQFTNEDEYLSLGVFYSDNLTDNF